jgi:hypothetical protein
MRHSVAHAGEIHATPNARRVHSVGPIAMQNVLAGHTEAFTKAAADAVKKPFQKS